MHTARLRHLQLLQLLCSALLILSVAHGGGQGGEDALDLAYAQPAQHGRGGNTRLPVATGATMPCAALPSTVHTHAGSTAPAAAGSLCHSMTEGPPSISGELPRSTRLAALDATLPHTLKGFAGVSAAASTAYSPPAPPASVQHSPVPALPPPMDDAPLPPPPPSFFTGFFTDASYLSTLSGISVAAFTCPWSNEGDQECIDTAVDSWLDGLSDSARQNIQSRNLTDTANRQAFAALIRQYFLGTSASSDSDAMVPPPPASPLLSLAKCCTYVPVEKVSTGACLCLQSVVLPVLASSLKSGPSRMNLNPDDLPLHVTLKAVPYIGNSTVASVTQMMSGWMEKYNTVYSESAIQGDALLGSLPGKPTPQGAYITAWAGPSSLNVTQPAAYMRAGLSYPRLSLVLFYRPDLLGHLPLPSTWDGLLGLAAAMQGRAFGNISQQDATWPLCLDLAPGCGKLAHLYTAIAASYVQAQGPVQGLHFEPSSWSTPYSPLTHGSAADAALRVIRALAAFSPPNAMGTCDIANEYFWKFRRQCAMTIDWDSTAALVLMQKRVANITAYEEMQGVDASPPPVFTALLPGSDRVLDRATGELRKCTASTCPYATEEKDLLLAPAVAPATIPTISTGSQQPVPPASSSMPSAPAPAPGSPALLSWNPSEAPLAVKVVLVNRAVYSVAMDSWVATARAYSTSQQASLDAAIKFWQYTSAPLGALCALTETILDNAAIVPDDANGTTGDNLPQWARDIEFDLSRRTRPTASTTFADSLAAGAATLGHQGFWLPRNNSPSSVPPPGDDDNNATMWGLATVSLLTTMWRSRQHGNSAPGISIPSGPFVHSIMDELGVAAAAAGMQAGAEQVATEIVQQQLQQQRRRQQLRRRHLHGDANGPSHSPPVPTTASSGSVGATAEWDTGPLLALATVQLSVVINASMTVSHPELLGPNSASGNSALRSILLLFFSEYWSTIGYLPGSPPPPAPAPTFPSLLTAPTSGAAYPAYIWGPAAFCSLAFLIMVVAGLCLLFRGRGTQLRWRRGPPGVGPKTTLLTTDVQNSTRLWEDLAPGIMDGALRLHNTCIRRLVLECRGYESGTEGDAFLLAFADAQSAARFSLLLQAALLELRWPPEVLAHEDGKEVWVVPGHPDLQRTPSSLTNASQMQLRTATADLEHDGHASGPSMLDTGSRNTSWIGLGSFLSKPAALSHAITHVGPQQWRHMPTASFLLRRQTPGWCRRNVPCEPASPRSRGGADSAIGDSSLAPPALAPVVSNTGSGMQQWLRRSVSNSAVNLLNTADTTTAATVAAAMLCGGGQGHHTRGVHFAQALEECLAMPAEAATAVSPTVALVLAGTGGQATRSAPATPKHHLSLPLAAQSLAGVGALANRLAVSHLRSKSTEALAPGGARLASAPPQEGHAANATRAAVALDKRADDATASHGCSHSGLPCKSQLSISQAQALQQQLEGPAGGLQKFNSTASTLAALNSGQSPEQEAPGLGGHVSMTWAEHCQRTCRAVMTSDAEKPAHAPAGARCIYRGLRVRAGAHSGIDSSSDISVNRARGTVMYGGRPMALAKAVTDAAAGGMVLFSAAAFEQLGPALPSHAVPVYAGAVMLHALADVAAADGGADDSVQLVQIISEDLEPRLGMFSPLRGVSIRQTGSLDAPVGFVTVCFIYIMSAAAIVADLGEEGIRAVEDLRSIAQQQCGAAGGYLIDCQGSLVLAAFAAPAAAMAWALNTHQVLLTHPWSAAVMEHPACEEVLDMGMNASLRSIKSSPSAETVSHSPAPRSMAGAMLGALQRGPRMRAGVHVGTVSNTLNRRTGRLEYNGKTLNRAARIAYKADDGQVLCSAAAWQQCQGCAVPQGIIPPGRELSASFIGTFGLKGVHQPMDLYKVLYLAAAAEPPHNPLL